MAPHGRPSHLRGLLLQPPLPQKSPTASLTSGTPPQVPVTSGDPAGRTLAPRPPPLTSIPELLPEELGRPSRHQRQEGAEQDGEA